MAQPILIQCTSENICEAKGLILTILSNGLPFWQDIMGLYAQSTTMAWKLSVHLLLNIIV